MSFTKVLVRNVNFNNMADKLELMSQTIEENTGNILGSKTNVTQNIRKKLEIVKT